jgi:hypothetical protein
VQRIEYVYQWWGLGEPVMDYQVIERDGGAYRRGSEVVEASRVEALLRSLVGLHPTQFPVAANSHTDDYPSWRLEFTGDDGRQLLLFSTSTGNSGSAPWNLLENGRLYAQYGGEVAEPLSSLFQSPPGQAGAAFFPGGWEPGAVYLATSSWPPQLTLGFTGLLPIADDIYYEADLATGTIHGYLQGMGSIGGFGTMVIGRINDLRAVTLHPEGLPEIPCTIETVSTQDPAGASWAFECGVGAAQLGDRYRLPITFELGSVDGSEIETNGVLTGTWSDKPTLLYLPPPEEVTGPISAHPTAGPLLSSHPLTFYYYTGERSGDGVFTAAGEAIILGGAEIDGRTLRFTLATPFGIERDSVTVWAVTGETLSAMLRDVSDSPVVVRAASEIPDLVLNLYYAETGSLPEMPPLINAMPPRYAIQIAECGEIPPLDSPAPGVPLRAFSLDGSWSLNQADFVLHDGRTLVGDLDLWSTRDERPEIFPILLPPELDTGGAPSFIRIWIQASSFLSGRPELTLWMPGDVDPLTTEPYASILASLPVPVEHWAAQAWVAEEMTFEVSADGVLRSVACDGP